MHSKGKLCIRRCLTRDNGRALATRTEDEQIHECVVIFPKSVPIKCREDERKKYVAWVTVRECEQIINRFCLLKMICLFLLRKKYFPIEQYFVSYCFMILLDCGFTRKVRFLSRSIYGQFFRALDDIRRIFYDVHHYT